MTQEQSKEEQKETEDGVCETCSIDYLFNTEEEKEDEKKEEEK